MIKSIKESKNSIIYELSMNNITINCFLIGKPALRQLVSQTENTTNSDAILLALIFFYVLLSSTETQHFLCTIFHFNTIFFKYYTTMPKWKSQVFTMRYTGLIFG